MQPKYYVDYLRQDGEWSDQYPCFSFLYFSSYYSIPDVLTIRLLNQLDQANLEYKTKDWLEFMERLDVVKYFENIEYDSERITCTIDLKKYSFNLVISVLTILRYAGEYYNICWNVFEILKRKPTIDPWKTLFLAHQGTFENYYLHYCFSYGNGGHSIFKPGNKWKNGMVEEAFKKMENMQVWNSGGYNDTSIHLIFNQTKYGPYRPLEELL